LRVPLLPRVVKSAQMRGARRSQERGVLFVYVAVRDGKPNKADRHLLPPWVGADESRPTPSPTRLHFEAHINPLFELGNV
jgi:hypothetical protein